MEDVYKRLAKKLDELPSGFPETETGVELKILKKIFTPEEAEMALKIKPVPETAEDIARRLGKKVDEMEHILNNMAKKGQIGSFKIAGKQMYMFFPFVIGIYEFQLHRLDKEMADLFEEYAPKLLKTVGGYQPPFARVIPINTKIGSDLNVHRYEDVYRMIDEANSFRVQECICRKEKALEGHGCKHSLEVCLSFSKEEKAYDDFPLGGRVISKEEAFKVLRDAEEEGLVHCTYNVQKGHVFVCNCCPCSCGILRGVKEFKAPYMLAKSNFVAVIDQDSCASCGMCKEERCPMDAIIEEDGIFRVDSNRCIGCGVCSVTCPTESITLIKRLEEDYPPANLIEWSIERAKNRGIELKFE